MLLPDGTVLMHDGAPYNPAQAHEYYLKYRKLHPKSANAQLIPSKDAKGHKAPTYTVKTGAKSTAKLTAQQLQEQKAYAAVRVNNTKAKLADMKEKLTKKLAAAAKAALPETAAQKSKDALAAAAYAAKHKTEIATKAKAAAAKAPAKAAATKAPSDSVDTLKTKISASKKTLVAEVAKQRQLATATKNG